MKRLAIILSWAREHRVELSMVGAMILAAAAFVILTALAAGCSRAAEDRRMEYEAQMIGTDFGSTEEKVLARPEHWNPDGLYGLPRAPAK